MKKNIFIIAIFLVSTSLFAQQQSKNIGAVFTTKQTPVHDPVLIKQGDTYYIFCTGWGIGVFSSKNMETWKREKPVFEKPPSWAGDSVLGYKGHTWAPDISYHDGRYYLFYSVSTFGKNNSCIGLAVNSTLDPTDPSFKWEDRGMVIRSIPGRDSWNAIDPNLAYDEAGKPWLSFGSFWGGIKLIELNNDFKPSKENADLSTIASRYTGSQGADSVAAGGAIEAPYIIKKNGYYYLFVSWDYCCKAEKSNYKVVVGRSKNIAGPYLDKEGKSMLQNGGTLFIEGDGKEWYAVGHNSIFSDDNGNDFFVAHGYDAHDKGRSKLIISKISWSNGWPYVKSMP